MLISSHENVETSQGGARKPDGVPGSSQDVTEIEMNVCIERPPIQKVSLGVGDLSRLEGVM